MLQSPQTAPTDATGATLDLESEQRDVLEALQSVARLTRWHRDQEVCQQDGKAENWYYIVSGAARKCLLRPSGQRHIVDLLFPGDMFGLTTRSHHRFAVQAVIEGTTIASFPRSRIEAIADEDPRTARELRMRAFSSIARLQEQLLIVGRTTALEKVGSFLLKMCERLPARDADAVILPISRYDIADYLGISVETVSRALSELKQCGLISLRGTRRIRIVDPNTLEMGRRNQ